MASRKAAAQAAIERLAAAKRGSGGGLKSVDVESGGAIFEELDEAGYAAMVAARRRGGDFVVDDAGLGYADDGEEHAGDDEDDEEDDDGGGEGAEGEDDDPALSDGGAL